jgi:transcriptional regulator with PAS, ATPase and Fis domain
VPETLETCYAAGVKPSVTSQLPLLSRALGAAAGPALVLDAELRVVLVTQEAKALLAVDVPLGAPAAKILCSNSPKRELAQAMVEGRPIDAQIPHPGRHAENRTLKVRSIVLGRKPHLEGFLLLIDEGFAPGAEPISFHGMWTRAPKMREVFRVIERVAAEDVTVLIRGETGTGKELVAQAIHALSKRASGPFRALNCAALPANLLESELFGHVRGAFTGAVRDTQGHFQLAHGGTLFLDEIGELPLELQAKLLRVLETRTVLPVGAQKPIPVDVRIVSATHRALRSEVEAGRFRADLMYRLRVIPIFLPALRERKEDIGLLCEQLMLGMNKTSRRTVERVAPPAAAILEAYDWPGNVRELQNVLAYAYTIGDGPLLLSGDLPPELFEVARSPATQAAASERSSTQPLSKETQQILEALSRTQGNKNQAAKLLGMSRVTLWRRMRSLGLVDSVSRR